jgi:xanthine dehydrogenase YagT iron-sulfur-binding subunit
MLDEHKAEELELDEDERELLAHLSLEEQRQLTALGESRREFLGKMSATGAAILAAKLSAREQAIAFSSGEISEAIAPSAELENSLKVAFKLNGTEKSLNVDSRMTLLDALRERLDLTGSKKGCDHGQCGACTVIVDGRRVLSCLTLAATCEGQNVTTIEGLAEGEKLHAMQAAFIKHDGFQCGYCTPGQICSAVALLTEAKNGEASYVTANLRSTARDLKLSDDEIRERMSGNLCRCGAYPNIVAAIREVHTGKSVDEAQAWSFAGGENKDETV